MSVICVGIERQGNIVLDAEKNTIEIIPNYLEFNKEKYLKLVKKSPKGIVYTCLGEIVYYLEDKDIAGYLMADNKGNIDIYSCDDFLKLMEKYECMNYSIVRKGNNIYTRKIPNVEIPKFLNSDIKRIYGVDLNSSNLYNDMSLRELEYCMYKNGFKLGYKKNFKSSYFGNDLKSCEHRIYFNKEGTQIIINYIEGGKLNWFGQDAVLMRNMNHDKYIEHIKNTRYQAGSSCPVDGPKTNITIFSYKDIHEMIRISKNAKLYSTPCKPYYLSNICDGLFFMVHLAPYQNNWLQKLEKNNSGSKSEYRLDMLGTLYIGLKNMERYSEELKEFYSNYIANKDNILKIEITKWKIDEVKAKSLMDLIDKAFIDGKL